MCLLSAYGFLRLKGSFSLPPLFVGGHALGFCNVPRYDFDCNRPYINKDDLICHYSRNWSETHFTFSFHPGCDPHQFAYRTKTTTVDTVSTDLPAAMSHLEQGRNRTQLFIIDNRLVSKLPELGISDSVCLWIRDFLTDRSWRVRIGPHVTPTGMVHREKPHPEHHQHKAGYPRLQDEEQSHSATVHWRGSCGEKFLVPGHQQ